MLFDDTQYHVESQEPALKTADFKQVQSTLSSKNHKRGKSKPDPQQLRGYNSSALSGLSNNFSY